MTMFVGGPYDGEDLPYNPYSTRRVRLPEVNGDSEGESSDSLGSMNTADAEWPHQYEADLSKSPPVYRFITRDLPG